MIQTDAPVVPKVEAARERGILDEHQAGRWPSLYILYIGSNARLRHIAAALLWSAKIMTNCDENETGRNVNGGYMKITIIKCIMQYFWRIKKAQCGLQNTNFANVSKGNGTKTRDQSYLTTVLLISFF